MNSSLRKTLRQKRKTITDTEKEQFGQQLTQVCAYDPWLTDSQHIACFLDSDGEIATGALIQQLQAMGRSVYLPVLDPTKTNELLFVGYQPNDKLIPNKYGILEPDLASLTPINSCDLDLVLMPLVAFDGRGNRLGMGGGYYDRTFSFLIDNKTTSQDSQPRMAGLAYSFQQVDQLEPASWDVPLQKVFTERAVISVQAN